MSVLKIKDSNGVWQDIPAIKGATGATGQNGITPTIGNNGNWYLDTTDTGKPSRGIQGETGQTGPAGQDGYSPTANISKSNGTATITITDKNGTTTATISDGTNGTNGRDGYVQYTAGDNITIENNVISATGGDLSNYYTKSETNNLIDNKMPTYTLNLSTPLPEINAKALNNEEKGALSLIFTDAYRKGYDVFNILCTYYDNSATSNKMSQFLCTPKLHDQTKLTNKPSTYTLIAPLQTKVRLSDASVTQYHVYIPYVDVTSLSWNDDVCTVTYALAGCNYITVPTTGYFSNYATNSNVLTKTNTSSYTPTANYHPATKKYVDDNTNVSVITSLDSTYTIASLVGNTSYKLGEITALTISATTTFDKESVIYFESGTTATTVNLPSSITNLGDAPTMTETDGVNEGTCSASKNYIIAIENNIAIWKEY